MTDLLEMTDGWNVSEQRYSTRFLCSDSCELGGDMIRYSGVEKKLKTGSRGWYDTGITKRDSQWRGEAQ